MEQTWSHKNRLQGYTPRLLKIARPIVWLGLTFIVLIGSVTIWEYHTLAQVQAHIALKEIIYQNTHN